MFKLYLQKRYKKCNQKHKMLHKIPKKGTNGNTNIDKAHFRPGRFHLSTSKTMECPATSSAMLGIQVVQSELRGILMKLMS
mmetsp:Transcript_11930/g.26143  ORF Transcript_11930/g.26143 Transcript_11930/m.26143 type:complete len:81 (+) Transcript_11930:27-269(+)